MRQDRFGSAPSLVEALQADDSPEAAMLVGLLMDGVLGGAPSRDLQFLADGGPSTAEFGADR